MRKKRFKTHYIPEWAEHRGLHSQAELQRALLKEVGVTVDKSTVHRWYQKDTMPQKDHQAALQALFKIDSPSGLFTHPHDDWLARLFKDRSEEERQKMLETLEFHFPKAS